LRVGSDIFFLAVLRREDARFGALFFAVLFFAALFFLAGPLRAALFLAVLFFLAGPREDDLRPEDFLTLLRPPAFFLPLAPPRVDFLAAAMFRAPI
jgi:hypothetical protein